jgi:uncharacterized protein (DUF2141 family)
MSKVRIGAGAAMLAAMIALPAAGRAAPAGPFAEACAAGQPAMLVHVVGFKARTGVVRVQSYGGDPDHYFDKGSYLKRIELRVPAAGALDVCVPVPAPGRYAVSVRHDIDGDAHTGRSDGGGMSGNPHLSLFDLMFKRKPAADQVAVAVGHGVRVVPIVLNYLSGTTFAPVAAVG